MGWTPRQPVRFFLKLVLGERLERHLRALGAGQALDIQLAITGFLALTTLLHQPYGSVDAVVAWADSYTTGVAAAEIAVVDIDALAAANVKRADERSAIACLLHTLAETQVRAVVVDVFFSPVAEEAEKPTECSTDFVTSLPFPVFAPVDFIYYGNSLARIDPDRAVRFTAVGHTRVQTVEGSKVVVGQPLWIREGADSYSTAVPSLALLAALSLWRDDRVTEPAGGWDAYCASHRCPGPVSPAAQTTLRLDVERHLPQVPHYSAAHMLGRSPAEVARRFGPALKDKVVFVGVSAPAAGDRFAAASAADKSTIPGVMVHAAAAHQLAAGHLLRPVEWPLQAAIYVLTALSVVIVLRHLYRGPVVRISVRHWVDILRGAIGFAAGVITLALSVYVLRVGVHLVVPSQPMVFALALFGGGWVFVMLLIAKTRLVEGKDAFARHLVFPGDISAKAATALLEMPPTSAVAFSFILCHDRLTPRVATRMAALLQADIHQVIAGLQAKARVPADSAALLDNWSRNIFTVYVFRFNAEPDMVTIAGAPDQACIEILQQAFSAIVQHHYENIVQGPVTQSLRISLSMVGGQVEDGMLTVMCREDTSPEGARVGNTEDEQAEPASA